MEILNKALQFILSISLLVVLHEGGHFFFARLFKTRVEKFYLFFDPWFSLFKIKKGDTEYGVGWLPLGGYVKISGMIDESMDKEQMKLPPQPHEFRSKKSWQRLLIMLGGILVNILVAFVIYIFVLFAWGDSYLPTENAKYGIMCDSTALDMGLKHGDKILLVDGNKVESFSKITHDVVMNNAKTITVERDGSELTINIPEGSIAKLINSEMMFVSPRFPFEIYQVSDTSVAKKAGLLAGDKIIAFDSQPIKFYDEVREALIANKNQEKTFTILRNQDTVNISLVIPDNAMIGVAANSNLADFFEFKTLEYSFIESIPAGISKGYEMIVSYLKQFRLMFQPETKAYEHLGGFMSIGNIFAGSWDWRIFWNMTAFLSIILAIMNLLPIPALDGGHVVFLLYEIVTGGRKPSDKFLEYTQIAGMIIVFGLILYANGNDIFKFFFK